MSTYFPKEGDIARKWFVVDATGLPLGRLASRVARILMGKENPKYTPFIDTGDHVVIINAEKIKITGMKADQKVYHRYTGYPGGLRSEEMKKRMVRKPELVIEDAVSRMLPKNKTGQADVYEAEGLPRRQASARGAEAGSEGVCVKQARCQGLGLERIQADSKFLERLISTRELRAEWLKAEVLKANMAELVQYYGTGRRKTAIARVFLRPGSGEFKVNGKAFDEYFVTPSQRIARSARWSRPTLRPLQRAGKRVRRRSRRTSRCGAPGHHARSHAVQR